MIRELNRLIYKYANLIDSRELDLNDETDIVEELGYDSLSTIQLIIEIEGLFGISIDDISDLHIYGVLKRYILSHIKYSDFYKRYLGIDRIDKINNFEIYLSKFRYKSINKRYIYHSIITKIEEKWKVSCSEVVLDSVLQCIKKLKSTENIDYYVDKLKIDGYKTRKMFRMIWDRKNVGTIQIKSGYEYIYLEDWNKYLAKRDGRVIAYCKISDVYEGFGNIVVFTEEEYRRQGFAETLLCLLLRKCQEKEIYPMYVVDSANINSIRLAKKAGFSIISEEIILSSTNIY